MTKGPDRFKMPLTYVQLKKTDANKKIYTDLRMLGGTNVRVEPKKVQKDFKTQCRSCQLYRHGQRNCHADPRCVKCAQAHFGGDCPVPKDTPPVCALCSGPHTATNKECPKAPYNITEEGKKTEQPQPTPPKPSPPKPRPPTKLAPWAPQATALQSAKAPSLGASQDHAPDETPMDTTEP